MANSVFFYYQDEVLYTCYFNSHGQLLCNLCVLLCALNEHRNLITIIIVITCF